MASNIRLALAATVVAALPLAAGATPLASATFSNFLPANRATVERFHCVGATSGTPDVVVEYDVVSTEPGQHASTLRRLGVRGQALPEEMRDEVNEVIGDGTLTGVSVGCEGDDIRIALQIFQPASIAPDACLADANQYWYVYYRGETGRFGFE